MELSIAIDDGNLAAATLDSGNGQRSELCSTALRSSLVRFKGFWEGLLNRLGDPRTHRTLAVAAVDDHLKVAVERKLHQVSTHNLHSGSSTGRVSLAFLARLFTQFSRFENDLRYLGQRRGPRSPACRADLQVSGARKAASAGRSGRGSTCPFTKTNQNAARSRQRTSRT